GQDFIDLEITLPPQTYMIPEVRVSASGEDPAYWIMRKAIGLAHYHLNEVLSYRAEIYIKGTAYFSKLPKAIARRIEVGDIRIKENEAYMLESLNEVKYTAPDNYEMHVIASQNTLPGYSQSVNPMDYINASLYQPQIETFISPLARNAFTHYKFSFAGSFIEGAYIIDKIRVTPKRKSQQLCEGYLYIVEDLWCLYSSDLSIGTIAGTLYLHQLYANIIMDAWLPVSHKIKMTVDVAGVDADVTYVSSLDYKDVELNSNLPRTFFSAETGEPEIDDAAPISGDQEKINSLLGQEELSNRDVARLSRLMEREAERARAEELEEPYNITGTTFTVEEDAIKNDSLFWNRIRPIPLTPEEQTTIRERDSIIGTAPPVAGSDSAGLSRRKKVTFRSVLLGDTYNFSRSRGRLRVGGLVDPSMLNFNTVDGLSYAQDFAFQFKIDSLRIFRTYLTAGYAFHRKAPLVRLQSNFFYAPLRRGNLELALDYRSADFNDDSGISGYTNMAYSLLLRENYQKLYEKINASLYNGIDLMNGLTLEVTAELGLQNSLVNTTDFSFFYREKKEYGENLPDTAITSNHPFLSDRKKLSWDLKLKYTPRQYYVLRSGRKHLRDSKWPTFTINYRQGIPVNETGWSDYSFISASASYESGVGLLSNLNAKVTGGYFIHHDQMHYSDFVHFKTAPLLFDFIGLENRFNLLDYYEGSTNHYWVESHMTITAPYLMLKLLPWFSERFWTESAGISYLKTPGVNHYLQAGYSINDIFFLMDAGIYIGFEDFRYRGFGFRMNFKL
ncbi:MAG: hypothetical protein JXR52_04195, partial [Bacteroidales bacterium]|nr:hypothetical protein [Bacteroidales bacterium]